MKIKRSVLVSLIGLLLLGSFYLIYLSRFEIFVWYMTPSHSFEQSHKSKQLDYSLVTSWFSLPEINDDADLILKKLTKEVQETKKADVFLSILQPMFQAIHGIRI